MAREIKFKTDNIEYGNINLEIKEEDFHVEVTFGLIYITVKNHVVYKEVVRIDGLSKCGIIKKVRPIIERELKKNGLDIKIVS